MVVVDERGGSGGSGLAEAERGGDGDRGELVQSMFFFFVVLYETKICHQCRQTPKFLYNLHQEISWWKSLIVQAQILARIHHKNLVSMIGYSRDGQHMALVYEYMSEGTLHEQIAGMSHESLRAALFYKTGTISLFA